MDDSEFDALSPLPSEQQVTERFYEIGQERYLQVRTLKNSLVLVYIRKILEDHSWGTLGNSGELWGTLNSLLVVILRVDNLIIAEERTS